MIELKGILSRITTTKDGGWAVTFEYPGDGPTSLSVAALATMRDSNLVMQIGEEGGA